MGTPEPPGATVDLHCHILPGIDDGAADLADSVAMAEQAAADGIEVICATPHIRHDHDVRIHELGGRAAELNQELGRRGVPVRVVAAGEVAETIDEGLTDSELGQVSIGGHWILLEPAPGPLSESLIHTAERLRARGYRSLIAHPERHPGEGMREVLAALVGAGCLVQATAALLAEGPASEALLDLVRAGLVHVLGSDSHSARAGRAVELSPALRRLRDVPELRPHLDWIARGAPAAILAGEDAEPPLPPSP
jgi:protein-tyrosine phosphatase